MRPLYSLEGTIIDEQHGGAATKWLITEWKVVDGKAWDVCAVDDEVCESWADQTTKKGGRVYIYPIEQGRVVYAFLAQNDPKLLSRFDDSFRKET